MTPSAFPTHRQRGVSSNGVALVIVLFAVALVSVVILAFLNLALLNRNISFSSAGQARANVVALTALNFIKGDFIAEIQDGSTQEPDPTGSKVPIYMPTTNTTMVPYRMTTNLTYPLDPAVPANLIKWSSGSYPLWPATTAYNGEAGPIRAYSGISTTNAAVNGHFINSVLWTKPDFNTNSTFYTKIVPEWVYLTREGPLTNTFPNTPATVALLANPAATNSNYVVGRYAYTVYDEGGLLDVLAAGYSPTTFTSDPTDVGRKGSQGFADLSQLDPTQQLLTKAQIDQFVNWRNAATGTTSTNYVNYLTTNAPATGFLQAAPGDQAFISRQDLIQYWTTELGASASLLPYLTTFTREKNAPSWGPEHDANDPNSSTYWNGSNTDTPYDSVTLNDPSGGISYAYHSNENAASANNRFFPDVRVETPFPRLSFVPGSTTTHEEAVVGEPLVKNRFDLSKLAWITYTGIPPAGVTYQDIYNYFGLIPNFSSSGVFMSWTYNHTALTAPTPSNGTPATDTSSIMTLDQVASLPPALAREPDFFELLQAAILRGSLGLCSGDPTPPIIDSNIAKGGEFYRAVFPIPNNALNEGGALYRPANADSSTPPHVVNAQAMYQIIQIGANIIDQYSSDNFPTEIILNGDDFYGIKNLPYISGIGDAALRASPTLDITSSTTGSQVSTHTAYQAYVHRWLDFALWNPHQNANSPPALRPTKIRISVVAGREFPYISGLGNFNPISSASAGLDYTGRIFEQPGTPISTSTQGFIDGPGWIEIKLGDYPNNFTMPTAITTAYTSDSDSPLDAGSLNANNPDGIITTAPGGNSSLGWQRSGIYLGWSKSPDNPYKVPPCAPLYPDYATTDKDGSPALGIKYATVQFYPSPPGLTIYLQYEDIANPGVWHTYQELHNLNYARNGGGDAWMEPNDPQWNEWLVPPTGPTVPPADIGETVAQIIDGSGAKTTYNGSMLPTMDSFVVGSLDPRSTRMNLWSWHNGQGYPVGGSGTDSMVTSTINLVGEPSKGTATGPHFANPANPTDAQWADAAETWVDNVSISPIKNYDNTVAGADPTSYYRDRDSIARVGDAAGWTNVVLPADASGDPKGASPLTLGAQMQRPLQLDRPFRSVADMGYVFRDDPWKSLNLISANSADAALMDIFYVGSSPTNAPTAPAPDIVAGKLNINSAALNVIAAGHNPQTSPVLQAVISQALRDYESPSNNPMAVDTAITTSSDIQSLSTNVVNYVNIHGPLMNIADLPAVFPQVPSATLPSPLYTGLKSPSEALMRSLADSSGTRTWNLMIDIVAQSGKFSSPAGNLNNFTVEGEKHYWLHVAIDRFTGEIVDQQLEPVWE